MSTLMFKNPALGFTFGYDPVTKGLYLISPHTPGINEQIAKDIANPEVAYLAVDMWCRGYKSREREGMLKKGSTHHHLFAETGKLGAKINAIGNAKAEG